MVEYQHDNWSRRPYTAPSSILELSIIMSTVALCHQPEEVMSQSIKQSCGPPQHCAPFSRWNYPNTLKFIQLIERPSSNRSFKFLSVVSWNAGFTACPRIIRFSATLPAYHKFSTLANEITWSEECQSSDKQLNANMVTWLHSPHCPTCPIPPLPSLLGLNTRVISVVGSKASKSSTAKGRFFRDTKPSLNSLQYYK